MLDLEARHLEFIKGVMRKHVPESRLIAFGSRVKGTAKKFSDLDLAVASNAPLTLRTLALIDADLEESDLPIKVDVIDLNSISPEFRHAWNEKGSRSIKLEF